MIAHAKPETIDDYMHQYAAELARQAAQACKPLHTPGLDPVIDCSPLLRPPFPAQQHCITAIIRQLKRDRSIELASEMGTGKSFMAIAAAHLSGAEHYRSLVFCPPHLTDKWERQIRMTIPNPIVLQISSYRDLTYMDRRRAPQGPQWFIIAKTMAKLGTTWRPAAVEGKAKRNVDKKIHRRETKIKYVDNLYCPNCHGWISKYDSAQHKLIGMDWDDLKHSPKYCEHCEAPLFQFTHELDRWPVAKYIHKKLKHAFDFFIDDEAHEAKAADTAVGRAMAALSAGCKKTICLTGTVFGGYAWHVRPLLWRIAPGRLVAEGLTWEGETAFNERYGRIEKKVVETAPADPKKLAMSMGAKVRTSKSVRPGIMPNLFGRHLVRNTIFLSLKEVAEGLPDYDERIIPCELDDEQMAAYSEVEEKLRKALAEMLRNKNYKLLSTFLYTLLAYPDHPFDWGSIGYHQRHDDLISFVQVCKPPNLSRNKVRPKEHELIDEVLRQKARGRKVWIYSPMTDTKDVSSRLHQLLSDAGLKGGILRSSVEPKKREKWIRDHGPGFDYAMSHQQLVQTGLDFFDDDYTYNFPTIIHYFTGYNPFILRQSSRRAWRLGQREPCEVLYLFYQCTMQARAMYLMGQKFAASEAMEGNFSEEGLAALAADDCNLNVALARSLVDRLGHLDVGRCWENLGSKPLEPVKEAVVKTEARKLNAIEKRLVAAAAKFQQRRLFE